MATDRATTPPARPPSVRIPPPGITPSRSASATAPAAGGSQKQRVTVRNRAPVAAFTYAPGAPLPGRHRRADVFLRGSRRPDREPGVGPRRRRCVRRRTGTVRIGVVHRRGRSHGRTAGDRPRWGAPRSRSARSACRRGSAQFLRPVPGRARDRRGRRARHQDQADRADASRPARRCGSSAAAAAAPWSRSGRGAVTARTLRIRRFARRLLRPGAVVQISVTKPGAIGKYMRLRIRRGRSPSRIDRCLPPGSRRADALPGVAGRLALCQT